MLTKLSFFLSFFLFIFPQIGHGQEDHWSGVYNIANENDKLQGMFLCLRADRIYGTLSFNLTSLQPTTIFDLPLDGNSSMSMGFFRAVNVTDPKNPLQGDITLTLDEFDNITLFLQFSTGVNKTYKGIRVPGVTPTNNQCFYSAVNYTKSFNGFWVWADPNGVISTTDNSTICFGIPQTISIDGHFNFMLNGVLTYGKFVVIPLHYRSVGYYDIPGDSTGSELLYLAEDDKFITYFYTPDGTFAGTSIKYRAGRAYLIGLTCSLQQPPTVWSGRYIINNDEGMLSVPSSYVISVCEVDDKIYGSYGVNENEPIGFFHTRILTSDDYSASSAGTLFQIPLPQQQQKRSSFSDNDFFFESPITAVVYKESSYLIVALTHDQTYFTASRWSTTGDSSRCLFHSGSANVTMAGIWALVDKNNKTDVNTNVNTTICLTTDDPGQISVDSYYYIYNNENLITGRDRKKVVDHIRAIGQYNDPINGIGGEVTYIDEEGLMVNYYYLANLSFGGVHYRTRIGDTYLSSSNNCSQSPFAPSTDNGGGGSRLVVTIVIACCIGLALLFLLSFCLRRCKAKKGDNLTQYHRQED